MGHLEACAAAAGLASLVVTPLSVAVVPKNAHLRRSVFKFTEEAAAYRTWRGNGLEEVSVSLPNAG